jgi:hypothetical protein
MRLAAFDFKANDRFWREAAVLKTASKPMTDDDALAV